MSKRGKLKIKGSSKVFPLQRLSEAMEDFPQRVAERMAAERDKKEQIEREELANLYQEVETKSPCVVCGNPIIEYKTSEFVDRGIIGPAGKRQYAIKREYYCRSCGLSYAFLPKNPRA